MKPHLKKQYGGWLCGYGNKWFWRKTALEAYRVWLSWSIFKGITTE